MVYVLTSGSPSSARRSARCSVVSDQVAVLSRSRSGVRRTSADTHGAIPAVVDYVEELGASRLIHADANGSRIVALDTETSEIRTGTPVHLSLADSALHLFSVEDGRRISH